jgi:photosystem II stability/assembly factor-like uncharacterized protein
MKKIFFSYEAIIVTALTVLHPLWAQTYVVHGNVSTSTDPVRYASVTFIEKSDTTKKFSAITDTAGNYQIGIITTVEKNRFIAPSNIKLEQNYPNPFSSSTAISYQINKQLDVSIKIYDILGRIVKVFVLSSQEIGGYGIVWDGTDNFDKKVSPGIYFYQMRAGNEMEVKKMVFGLGGINISMAKPKTDKYFTKELKKENKAWYRGATARSYTVQITNTDSTTLKIVSQQFNDILIQRDTTLNFVVTSATAQEQWQSLGLLGLEDETIIAIELDPTDSNIIYLGTKFDFSAGILGKLFKSIDGGATWNRLLIGGSYTDVLIDPTNHNIIYALPDGLIKSEDGGQTWQPINNGIYLNETRLMRLAINPKDSKVLYAGTGGIFGGNLYKSYDGGLHWNKVPSDSLRDGVISIAIDPTDTNTIYVGTAWRGILWKSTDAGNTWFRTGLGETGYLIHDILINPNQPSTVYAGHRGIFKSEDGGVNWKNISQGLPTTIVDVVKIQRHYSSRLFLVATYGDDGGIYEYSFQKNEWIKIGIDAVLGGYYSCDLKILPNSNNLYYGAKGMYVRVLKE